MSALGAGGLAALIAMLVPGVFGPAFSRLLLARGQVDHPDSRRVHQGQIPRGGGLLIAVGLLLGLMAAVLTGAYRLEAILPIIVMVSLLCALGAADDARGLGVRVRFALQLSIGAGLLAFWGGFDAISLGGGWTWHAPWVLVMLALVAFVWMVNLHNFMDGLDGLASQQAIWSGFAYAIVFFLADQDKELLLASLLVAAGLGFMRWNRPRAIIFLGDSGSLLIGGLVGWLAIRALQTDAASLAICLLISAPFVVDATATLLRRLIRGERWYTPHRSHAYQRLADRGWPPARVLLLYIGVNIGLVLPALTWSLVNPSMAFVLMLGVVGILSIGWWRIQSAEHGEVQAHD